MKMMNHLNPPTNHKNNVEDIYELAPLQQGMLFETLYAPASGVYVIQFCLRLEAGLQVSAFRQAWQEVLNHHPILRTLFIWQREKAPLQLVRRAVALPWTELDWQGVVDEEQALQAWLTADRQRGFVVEEAPLLRCTLMRLRNGQQLFVWTHHHLISDGWSMPLLLQELVVRYRAASQGQAVAVASVRPYRDYILWLRRQDRPRAAAFWQAQVAHFTAPTALGVARGELVRGTEEASYATVSYPVVGELTARLTAFAQQQQLTLNTVVQGAWALLLGRYSGTEAVLFGATVAGRPATLAGVEAMVGLFINTIPVAVSLPATATVLPWLQQLQQTQAQAQEYAYLPLTEIQGWSAIPRGVPLFDTLLVFENYPVDTAPLEDGFALVKAVDSQEQTNYPLTVGVAPGAELRFTFSYDTRRFGADTIARLFGHLQTLLAGMIDNPHQCLPRLPLLTAAEAEVLLRGWNATAVAYPSGCIHELFAAQVQRTPGAVALRSGEEQLCYAELDARANQLAHYLQGVGVGPNVLVGLCVERSLDMVIGLLGILKAGGAYVPLDPTYPAARLAFMLTDAAPPVLLTQAHLVATLPPVAGQLFCLDRDWPRIATQPTTPPLSAVTPDHLAYVIYTSGSTGQPKGAMLSHRNVCNQLHWLQATYPLTTADRFLQQTPISFDASVREFFWTLSTGASLVLAEPNGHRDPTYLLEAVQQYKITVIKFVPILLKMFLAQAGVENCSTLRLVFCGGEALPFELQAQFFQTLPADLINLYGPTETALQTVVWQCNPHTNDQIVPIGRPIANTQLYVLDAYFQPVPVGVAGELYIGGVQVGLGYLKRPALTAERFIANSFGAGRLYKSGDLVRYLPDGNLEYLGRLDQQVKLRGFRIELGEIEAALTQHPAVQAGVVIVRTGASGEPQLVAYVVLRAAADGLREYLCARLPEYMVPSHVVVLEQLPLMPNGKLDRQGLPAPVVGERQPEAAPDVARTPTEAALAAIWQGVLQVPGVGLDENFFSLGGDSILSIQVVARARQAGLHLTPRQLFQQGTIRQLAAVATPLQQAPAPQGAVTGALVLTPIQHWFLAQAWTAPHHYNQAVLLETAPGVNPLHLQGALTALVRHHDALRLRFALTGGAWTATHGPAEEEAALQVLDLRGLGADQRAARLAAAADAAQASLDLGEGPLLRALYCAYGTEPGRLLLVIHHLVVDGVSWRILLEDLALAYDQLAAGAAVMLPAKSSAFQAWGAWLATQGVARLAAERAWWQGVVAQCRQGLPRDLPLPEGSPAPLNTIGASAEVTSRLDAATTTALLSEAPAAYHTQINDLLLAALAQTVSQWAGQPQVAVALEGHGRELLDDEETGELELARTVGWFTSLFPVVLTVADPTPAALIPAIKEQLRQIPQRGIGYGVLRYLEDSAGLVPPVPLDLSFNYLGQFSAPAESTATPGLIRAFAQEAVGQSASLSGLRTHLLDVNALISEGELHVTWRYSRHYHQPATVEALAQAYLTNLRTLVTHCGQVESPVYTPSDFTASDLTQVEVAQWVSAYARAVEDIYELAPLQQGMLFETLYAPASGVYVIQFCLRLEAGLQVSAFRQAWQEVLNHHPILRTLFIWQREKAPLQLVRRAVALPWTELDWQGVVDEEQALQAWLTADRQRGFVVEEAPLLRCTLMRLRNGQQLFVWTHHHLISDGWSMPLLLQELVVRYRAASQGQAVAVASVRPYRDYILWLRRQDRPRAAAFWQAQVAHFTAPTALGVARGELVRGTEEASYATVSYPVVGELTARLTAFAQQQQLTLNTVVQGAWALLLGRYSGTEAVLFGATVAGRPATLAGVEAMVGLFINTIPVAVSLPATATVLPWLQQLQQTQAQAQEYAYLPLTEIQGWSAIPRGVPLFDTLLVFENYPVDTAPLEDGFALVKAVDSQEQTNYPLTVGVAPGAELRFTFSYDTRRFGADTIARLFGHLQTLLAGMIDNPHQCLPRLPLLTAAEEEVLLRGWNATAVAYPSECIHARFAAQVQHTPGAVALWYGEAQLSYGALEARANQLAHYLQGLGVGPNVLVGLCVERSLDMVIGLLGILKAGGAYVPLDPTYPAARLAFMLADAAPPVLLTQAHLVATLPPVAGQLLCLDRDWPLIATQPTTPPVSAVTPDHLAYVIYTSGSTGQPKGAMNAHRGVMNRLLWMQETYGLQPDDCVLQKTPFSFDVSVWEFFWPLLTGASMAIAAPEGHKDPSYLTKLIRQYQVTTLHFVPSMLNAFLLADGMAGCDSVRRVICSGEALPYELQQRFFRQSDAELHNLYGPTEAAVDVSFWACRPESKYLSVPIGRPVANTQLYILDPYLQPVPIGVAGELHIGGVQVGLGYLHRPALTAEKFIADPFRAGRLYKTGDLARYLPDGNIEYLGRLDHQVKIRGFRIELGEIESLLATYPGVQESVVLAREDIPGDQQLVAYLVLSATDPLDLEAVRRYLQATLPDYMVPNAFVVLPALPLSPNGKLDRKALPAPERSSPFAGKVRSPRDAIEQQLAIIWMELLACSAVDIEDNFFALGGNSLLAIRLVAALQNHFGQTLPLASLFAQPTIRQLAEQLRHSGVAEHWSPLVTMQPHGDQPPFFCVHPVGGDVLAYYALARQLGPAQPFYALQAVGLDGITPPYTTIEAMAARYVIELQRVQPSGPYYLGGYSLGGKIAYAMAQVLKQAGQEIAQLVILDTSAPTPCQDPYGVGWDDTAWLCEWITRIELTFDVKLHVLEEQLRSRPFAEQLRYVNHRLQQQTQGSLAANDEQWRGLFQVFKANSQAQYSSPGAVPVPIALLRTMVTNGADPATGGTQSDPAWGWGALAAGPVAVYEIPGDHVSMLKPPQVQIVAAQLRQCLCQAKGS